MLYARHPIGCWVLVLGSHGPILYLQQLVPLAASRIDMPSCLEYCYAYSASSSNRTIIPAIVMQVTAEAIQGMFMHQVYRRETYGYRLKRLVSD